MFDFLKRLLLPRRQVATLSEVRPGNVILEGVLRSDGEVLYSPIKNVPCLAYYYQARFVAAARSRAVERALQDAEVYAPRFAVELEGGRLSIRPSRSAPFTAGDHQRLLGSRLDGFRAVETLIRAGDRVRIKGRVRSGEDGPYLEPDEFEMLEAAADPGAKKRAGKGKKRG